MCRVQPKLVHSSAWWTTQAGSRQLFGRWSQPPAWWWQRPWCRPSWPWRGRCSPRRRLGWWPRRGGGRGGERALWLVASVCFVWSTRAYHFRCCDGNSLMMTAMPCTCVGWRSNACVVHGFAHWFVMPCLPACPHFRCSNAGCWPWCAPRLICTPSWKGATGAGLRTPPRQLAGM